MKKQLNITSEIGELKTVVLHRPGKEVENLTPNLMERLLFDDIPYLPVMQKEHDRFADALRSCGTEVLYLEDLVSEALHTEKIKHEFVKQVLQESKLNTTEMFSLLKEYLLSFSTKDLIKKVMAGVLKSEIKQIDSNHLNDMLEGDYPFLLDPMPNLYFTRDPAAVIGNGISINQMFEGARQRESLFMEYIMKHHPRFAAEDIPRWYDRDDSFSLEGGDELVLSSEVAAIGVSLRTSAQAIENLAQRILSQNNSLKKVIAVEIPKTRAYMHLDTVFTMVDYDKFTIHPDIQGPDDEMNIHILEQDPDDNITISKRTSLTETLKEVLHLTEIVLIPCGGGHEIAAPREQWNDGSNTLAVAPGVVVTYDRNYVSNQLLRDHGIKVIEIPSSELSRGRGGPRCMSMPIVRKDL
ncbi:arginine deiminase [Mesobacillus harenae]|uniref:arginine deiminase n=1 Tax=Mesobacillus harenae TaxID=2213203 RepID=UPI0015801F78|nr:arginine deiminase [Mesobacillus harenae]